MNSRQLLKEVVNLLKRNKIQTWVFGGWAEEISGVIKQRKHNDIDLLYPSENFSLVDNLLSNSSQPKEIKTKHFPHKRAFIYKSVMVELFLVQKKNGKYFTNFWGTKKHHWPNGTFDNEDKDFRVVSKEALTDYRSSYKKSRK